MDRPIVIMAAGIALLALAGCGSSGGGWTDTTASNPPTAVTGNRDFFPGVTGSGQIPSAARAPQVNNSPEVNAISDAFPSKANFSLGNIRFVDSNTISGTLVYSDPAASLVATPLDFADSGKDYPPILVAQPELGLVVESQGITYYASGYRDEMYHLRSWWAVIAGKARVNGVDGYTFAAYIDDGRNPNDPTDTRTGLDYFALSIFAPDKPYGWTVTSSGAQRWGIGGVLYYNQYYLQQGDITAIGTPPEPR